MNYIKIGKTKILIIMGVSMFVMTKKLCLKGAFDQIAGYAQEYSNAPFDIEKNIKYMLLAEKDYNKDHALAARTQFSIGGESELTIELSP